MSHRCRARRSSTGPHIQDTRDTPAPGVKHPKVKCPVCSWYQQRGLCKDITWGGTDLAVPRFYDPCNTTTPRAMKVCTPGSDSPEGPGLVRGTWHAPFTSLSTSGESKPGGSEVTALTWQSRASGPFEGTSSCGAESRLLAEGQMVGKGQRSRGGRDQRTTRRGLGRASSGRTQGGGCRARPCWADLASWGWPWSRPGLVLHLLKRASTNQRKPIY
ncbi:uncharacterized protein LOC102477210 [Tupaia chinensis]|uniref:uncharacterized protein LOC102477210 n=1 Tax=Tupaia chinensis TaxID=246437 RepID=UPI0003C91A42|nr:uncharacterized protein LOC102477210 [Tupaia chinensis]